MPRRRRQDWEPGTEKLSEKVWKGRQSWNYEALWKIRNEKVKISIIRDAYDFQSSAQAKVYDPKERKWNFLANLPHPMMASLHFSYVADPESFRKHNLVNFFYQDEEALIKEIKLLFE